MASLMICCYIMALHPNYYQQSNTPPKVVISRPDPKDRFTWNSLVRYKINIVDKEDGVSKYDEIIPREVILKTTYLPDSAQVPAFMNNETKSAPEPKGLILIKTSTCFNCHAVKNKLIGPSFDAIVKRYSRSEDSIKMLATKIIKGSRYRWGNVEMPPNPEMHINDAREIVRWIRNNSANPNVDYLPGLEGTFHTISKPSKNAGKGVYVLTASYTDHGVPQMPQQHKEGKHSIMLKSY